MTLEPGLHLDIPAADYHSDPCATPSLSSSIAKVILGKTPRHAWLKHPRLNPDFKPTVPSPEMILGSAVHEIMLGSGSGIEVIAADDWRGKRADLKKDILARGLLPLLGHQYDAAAKIAATALATMAGVPGCESFFSFKAHSEAVIVWKDDATLCRAMIDRLSGVDVWDIKTTGAGLSDDTLMRTIVNFGYDLSAAFYLRGINVISPELAGRFVFKWIFIETEPPYEIRVIEADSTTMEFGYRKARAAIQKWGSCLAHNEWPGWPRAVSRLQYPPWAESSWLDREMAELCD
jgi:PDDEXK-like domain of unknown function (DUF3799)